MQTRVSDQKRVPFTHGPLGTGSDGDEVVDDVDGVGREVEEVTEMDVGVIVGVMLFGLNPEVTIGVEDGPREGTELGGTTITLGVDEELGFALGGGIGVGTGVLLGVFGVVGEEGPRFELGDCRKLGLGIGLGITLAVFGIGAGPVDGGRDWQVWSDRKTEPEV